MIYQGPYYHHHPEVVNYLLFYLSKNTKTATILGSGLRIIGGMLHEPAETPYI